MAWRTHLRVMILAEFLGFALAGITAMWLFIAQIVSNTLLVNALLAAVLIGVGTAIPRVLFRSLIPARCPTPACPGPCRPEGTRPITYRCHRCGWEHATAVREGDPRDMHTGPDPTRFDR